MLNDRLKYSAGLLHLNVMRGVDGNDRISQHRRAASLNYSPTPQTTFPAASRFRRLRSTQRLADGGRHSRLKHSSGRHRSSCCGFHLLSGSRRPRQPPFIPVSCHSCEAPADPVFRSQRLSQLSAHAHMAHFRQWSGRFWVPAGRRQLFQICREYRYIRCTFHGKAIALEPADRRLEFERETYDEIQDNNLPALQRIRTQTGIHQRAHALYFQDQTGVLQNRFQISISGRAQTFALSHPAFQAAGIANTYDRVQLVSPPKALTADLSMSYFANTFGTKLRAHAGNAYRAPGLSNGLVPGSSPIRGLANLYFRHMEIRFFRLTVTTPSTAELTNIFGTIAHAFQRRISTRALSRSPRSTSARQFVLPPTLMDEVPDMSTDPAASRADLSWRGKCVRLLLLFERFV